MSARPYQRQPHPVVALEVAQLVTDDGLELCLRHQFDERRVHYHNGLAPRNR